MDFADNDKVSGIAKSLLASSVEICINVVAKHKRNCANDKVSGIAKSLLASSFVEISINVVAKHERNWWRFLFQMLDDTDGALGKKESAEQKKENVEEDKERSRSKEKSSRKPKDKKGVGIYPCLIFNIPIPAVDSAAQWTGRGLETQDASSNLPREFFVVPSHLPVRNFCCTSGVSE